MPSLIFFVYPDPKGSEENQFTPLEAGVNKLIFKRFWIYYVSLPIVIYFKMAINENKTYNAIRTIGYSNSLNVSLINPIASLNCFSVIIRGGAKRII